MQKTVTCAFEGRQAKVKSRAVKPRVIGPRAIIRVVEHRIVEPGTVKLRIIESRTVELRIVKSRTVELRIIELRTAKCRTIEHKTIRVIKCRIVEPQIGNWKVVTWSWSLLVSEKWDIGIIDPLMPPFDTLQGVWQVSYKHGWVRGCARSWRP